MNSIAKKAVQVSLTSCALVFSVLLAVCPLSCRSSSEGLSLLSGDFTVPTLTSCSLADAEHVHLTFSKAVDAQFLSLCESDGREIAVTVEQKDNEVLVLKTAESLSVGKHFVLAGEIADRHGNTLTFSLPLNGYNDRVPSLAITEVRNLWRNSNDQSEYVEILCLTEGNLSGIEFDNAYKAGKKKYVFPSVEVKAGEYIVLHLQTLTDDSGEVKAGLVDEQGSNLSLCTINPKECLNSARDLWALSTDKTLGATDIVLLRNTNDGGSIVDALVYKTKGKEGQWSTYYDSLAQEIAASGVWKNAEGENCCCLDCAADISELKTAYTKSLSRKKVHLLTAQNLCSKSSDWAVTQSSGFTPGKANSVN